MTLNEAKEIFEVWRNWYWPCHFLLQSAFCAEIPESFLPYTIDVLEEALNIVAKYYYDSGNYEICKSIQETMCGLGYYANNEEAWESAAKLFSNPEIMRINLGFVENFKKDYISWLKKQGKI